MESGFCPDLFWDPALSWDTEDPDLSVCFQQTVFVYVPAIVLLLGTPLTLKKAFSNKDGDIPNSLLHFMKIRFNVLLVIIALIEFGYFVFTPAPAVNLLAAVVRLVGYSAAALLLIIQRKKALVTSATLFLYWLLVTFGGLISFRSALKSGKTWGDNEVFPVMLFAFQVPFMVGLCFLNFFAEPKPRYINPENDVPNLSPETYAPFPSTFVYTWFDPLAWKGYRQLLKASDLYGLTIDRRCAGVVPRWFHYWNRELKRKESKKEHKNSREPVNISILSTLAFTFGAEYSVAGVYYFFYAIVTYVNPVLVDKLITFAGSDEPQWHGFVYAFCVFLATLFCSLMDSRNFFLELIVGLKVRTALTAAIFRKSVQLSNSGRKLMTVGETTNLMSIDTQRFMDLAMYLHMAWGNPLQIVIAMVLLWNVLGPSSLAGLAVMVLMIPLNGVVAKLMRSYQFSQMTLKDNRCKLMDEILNGIKVLKLYGWEPSFEKRILEVRDKEVMALTKAAYLSSFTSFLWTCAPFLVALASFLAYVLLNPDTGLTPNVAFVSLTLFNLLRFPLNFLPFLIVYIVQCEVSLRRINTFMNADTLDPLSVSHDPNLRDPIHVEEADFAWDKNAKQANLKEINLRVSEGQLVAVVGSVGSGKSSLLSALLGEMERQRGTNNLRGSVAYVPQQAWMQNTSLKSNITFGKKLKESLYSKVIESCALVPDLAMLPGGDQTEIGEKGINLSGGQKQRISMARAVYSNSNVYLLDDPLSAVDAHVGKHIFEQVIGPDGLLKRKTRVLVTHGVGYLPQVDKIYVMKDGRISEEGTYRELLAQRGEFSNFLIEYLAEEEEKASKDEETEAELEDLKQELEMSLGPEKFRRSISQARSAKSGVSDLASSDEVKDLGRSRQLEAARLSGRRGSRRDRTFSTSNPPDVQEDNSIRPGAVLIEDEGAEVGSVKMEVYLKYAKAVGLYYALGTLIFFTLFQGFQVSSSVLLSAWTTDPAVIEDPSVQTTYLVWYGMLGLGQAIFVMLGTVTIMVGTLQAAKKLHANMLHRIIHSPMFFFDTTPIGRILNRFSKDLDFADVTIPLNFRMFVVQCTNVIGTLIIMLYASPIFIVVAVPVALGFFYLQKYYVATARQVKRMESVSRSPIYSHFGETLSGAPTIRAFNMVNKFIADSNEKVDFNQVCYYPSIASQRWLSVRLQALGNVIVTGSAIIAVLARGIMDPGKVGLSLSYSFNIFVPLQILVRMISEIETNMVSVERIIEYQNLVQEAPYEIPENDPAHDWPQSGVVTFDNYQTRYREGLDLVLKGISCTIKSGEKIGIVGRTGAGKSSLTLALFRIIEAAGGSIQIDGQNVGMIGLGRLRTRLTIIPQDPVLFSGSMRMNLDPFSKYSDRDIWKALDLAHLKSYVSNLAGGLHFVVTEGGDNLSVGQRQLVCLARALLRKTKVLILDEATAAVDMETDDLIQRTIRSEFADCTVLTIAHRLNTILDSSRVLVLDAGKVVEFDTPNRLLRNTNSIFYGMVKNAGLVDKNAPTTKDNDSNEYDTRL